MGIILSGGRLSRTGKQGEIGVEQYMTAKETEGFLGGDAATVPRNNKGRWKRRLKANLIVKSRKRMAHG